MDVIADILKDCDDEYLLQSGGSAFAESDDNYADEPDDQEEIFDLKKLAKEPQKRWCFCHPDCHANEGNVCMALRDTRFGNSFCGGNCPFYKTTEQYVADRKKALQQLMKSGNSSLIYRNAKELDDWELEYIEELTREGMLGDLSDLGTDLLGLIEETENLEAEAEELQSEMGTYDQDDSDLFDDDQEE